MSGKLRSPTYIFSGVCIFWSQKSLPNSGSQVSYKAHPASGLENNLDRALCHLLVIILPFERFITWKKYLCIGLKKKRLGMVAHIYNPSTLGSCSYTILGKWDWLYFKIKSSELVRKLYVTVPCSISSTKQINESKSPWDVVCWNLTLKGTERVLVVTFI